MFSRFDGYERFMGRWSRTLAPSMVSFGEVRDGDVVLDVGCGTGALSVAVCDATSTSRITGIDPSEAFVAHAAETNACPRLRFEVGDCQALGFADGTFDRTLSMLVLNFVPRPELATKEMIRVTKPGGVVAAAVWDYAEGMEMLRVFWDEVRALDPALEAHDEARMRFARRGELGAVWKQAGLADVVEAPISIPLRFASFEDYWAPFLLGVGPAGECVAALPETARAGLAHRLRTRLLGDDADRAILLHARAWAVKGTVC